MSEIQMLDWGIGNIWWVPSSQEIPGWDTQGVTGGANGVFRNLDPMQSGAWVSFGSRAITDAFHDAGGILMVLPDNDRVRTTSDYKEVWNADGVHGGSFGRCWLPTAPDGYTALGLVFTTGDTPDFSVGVVRNDLVQLTTTVNPVWSTAGIPGGADLSLSCAPLLLQSSDGQDDTYYMSAGTFLQTATTMPMLKVTFPSTVPAQVPSVPALTSIDPPPATVETTPDGSVTVPYFAVSADNDQGNVWKVTNSPIYTIQRELAWNLQCSGYNSPDAKDPLDISHAYVSGVTSSSSESFSHTVGVTITASTGVSIGVESSIEISLNYQFNYTTTQSRDEMWSNTVSASHQVEPGENGAIWTISRAFQVQRADGSLVPDSSGAVAGLSYFSPNYAFSQYPQ